MPFGYDREKFIFTNLLSLQFSKKIRPCTETCFPLYIHVLEIHDIDRISKSKLGIVIGKWVKVKCYEE